MIEKTLMEYGDEEVLLSQRIAVRKFFTIVKEIKTRRIKQKRAIRYILSSLYGITEEDLEIYLDAMIYILKVLQRKTGSGVVRWVKRVKEKGTV